MQAMLRKEEKLKKKLQKVLDGENLQQQRDLIERMTSELNLNMLDCAAALLYINQPNLFSRTNKSIPDSESPVDFEIPLTAPQHKTVRYRLEVGSKHQVKEERIKEVLVEESGVDRNRIGKVDIRQHYTIVELPDGMPADIFQLLTDVEIARQKLNIKRLKSQRKFRRFRNRQS